MQDAVQGVKDAAASAGSSGQGKLDKALKTLLISLDAASSSDRSVSLILSTEDTCQAASLGYLAFRLQTVDLQVCLPEC